MSYKVKRRKLNKNPDLARGVCSEKGGKKQLGVCSRYKVLKIIRLLNCKHQGSRVLAQKIMKMELSKVNLKRKQVKRGQLITGEEETSIIWLAVLN